MSDSATEVHERWSWADHGSCAGKPELFYHRDDDPKKLRRRREDEAKSICAACPVKVECQRYAMENRELYGVWGGLTENERHRLKGRSRTG